MDTITVIIIAVCLVALAADAYVIPWWRKRKEKSSAPTQEQLKAHVDRALKALNSKAEWSKEKDGAIIGRYTYQAGHFGVRVEKESPYVKLSYLYFYETELDDLEMVRAICNQCNINTDECRLVYTVEEKEGKVNVHILATVMPGDDDRRIMERAMGMTFTWQNIFVRRYNETKEHNDQDANHDTEKGHAISVREATLLHEEEMMHQEGGPDWHEAGGDPMTLRQLLATTMGLTDIVPATLTLTTDGKTTTLDDTDAIPNYAIGQTLIDQASGSFAHQATFGQLDFYDPRRPKKLRRLMVSASPELTTSDTLYYRVTMALVPASVSKTTAPESMETQRKASSVLLGHDLTPSKQRLDKFRYTWKEAIAKREAGNTDGMSDDERLLANIQDPHFAHNVYRGMALYEQKRFYEAALLLENAFRTASTHFDLKKDHPRSVFFEVCYLTGECYSHLQQYEKASYYLQLIVPLNRVNYAEAYVNCLVNGRDFRAMGIIDGMLMSLRVQGQMNDHEEEEDEDEDEDGGEGGTEDYKPFHNFLLRRKAYLLVEEQHYKDAEKLLKRLLDDPESTDFAMRELAVIQKRRGKS